MNKLNYATLPASKRLVDAGIVLETEAAWVESSENGYELQLTDSFYGSSIPAPCMAEVWRELPDGITIKKWDGKLLIIDDDGTNFNINPTDALIDLLIWVRKEAHK